MSCGCSKVVPPAEQSFSQGGLLVAGLAGAALGAGIGYNASHDDHYDYDNRHGSRYFRTSPAKSRTSPGRNPSPVKSRTSPAKKTSPVKKGKSSTKKSSPVKKRTSPIEKASTNMPRRRSPRLNPML